MNFKEQLNLFVNEYKNFMGISQFPEFYLQTKFASLAIADSQGFESAAVTAYQPITGQHSLCGSTNLELSKYLMFHEFTHMYDSEIYVNGDKVRYAGLSGYTEYHASQVELACLVGAETIGCIPSFSMNKVISTFAGNKRVSIYVKEKYQHAIDLFSRDDFPANISTLKSAFGVLYNYYGLRSICEMYAIDYVEEIKNEPFLKIISTQNYVTMNNLMHGWLNSEQIE